MNWETIENAIRDAVTSTTYEEYQALSLDAGSVYWAGQKIKPPDSGFFVTLQLGAIPEQREAVQEATTEFDAGNPGAEITRTIRVPTTFTVSIQVFSPFVVGGQSGRAIALGIKNNLLLSSVRLTLNEAGVGLTSPGAVQWIPAVEGTEFRGRAVLEPSFYVLDTATETSTYIQTVNVTKVGP